MTIEYAILGLLSWQPMSGYDLKKIFEDSVVYYWSGNNNQIYRNLVDLHNNELVEREVQPQENLPARKVYSITAKGRRRLADWVAQTQPELSQRKHAFLLQLAWADLLSQQALDDLLARYEEEVFAQWKMVSAREAHTAHPDRTPREALLWQAVAQNWIDSYEQELHWVRGLRKQLSGLPGE